MERKKRVDIITMGCSKNLVDSERLLYLFREKGYEVRHNPDEVHCDIAVVNTCGFIGDAKEESINMILSLCQQKEQHKLHKIYVMGCLSERYLSELESEIPQVDKYYGKFDWEKILEDLSEKNDASYQICHNTYNYNKTSRRILTTPSHYAYIKIAEGCDRKCAYCAIPLITGKYVSRCIEDIVSEVKAFVLNGVREFQLIAQDLTYYGVDIYGKQEIATLVETIARIPGVEWIRLHYTYPTCFPEDLFRVMREYDNVCKYLDVALQHVSTPVLRRMRRNMSKEDTYNFVSTLRKQVPGVCIRTTLMVGFPGETEADFEELKTFVSWARFNRMGAFAYSEEEGTYAAEHYKDDVPLDVKQYRLNSLMTLQQEISASLCQLKLGNVYRVIIDRQEGDYYIGRTEFDSPDVDGEVLIHKKNGSLTIGAFYQIMITEADEFDLYGSVIKS